jgi:hypothetical protein
MPNKKTVKRNKRNSKRSRNIKGGFFGLFKDKHNTGNTACNPNNLANLTDSNSMRTNYQTCCPKNWYGSKNNSPYCKQLDLNYKAASQKNQMEIASTKQMINTKRFNVNDNNSISVIDCKNPSLYNTEEEIQQYITSCECNKTRYNPFSEKKANCAIIKPKLERLKQEKEEQERDTLVTNPLQQNNGYNPIPNQEEDQRPSVNYPDDDIPPPPPVNAEGVPPVNSHPEGEWKVMGDYNLDTGTQEIDTVGGKRRKTKKHFKKRSIKKRKGRNH